MRGEGADRYAVGDRVGVAWLYHILCDGCNYCHRGLESLFPSATYIGLHADGGYAGAMLTHEGFIYPIPAERRSA